MNWGTKIAIFYSSFVVVTLGAVFSSTFHRWDLVTEDYYGEELKYQAQIDKTSNTKSLAHAPTISLDGQQVIVQFPEEFKQANPSGKINFYKPSDKLQDFEVSLALNEEGKQIIPIIKEHSGKHTAQLFWSANGKSYYQEFYLLLP